MASDSFDTIDTENMHPARQVGHGTSTVHDLLTVNVSDLQCEYRPSSSQQPALLSVVSSGSSWLSRRPMKQCMKYILSEGNSGWGGGCSGQRSMSDLIL